MSFRCTLVSNKISGSFLIILKSFAFGIWMFLSSAKAEWKLERPENDAEKFGFFHKLINFLAVAMI